MKYFLLVILLFFSTIASFAQTVQWMQNFDTSNQAMPEMMLDSAGNSYIYNAIYTGVRANIVKFDKNGTQLWSIKMLDSLQEGNIFYAPLFITTDSRQNVYGITTEMSYTGFDIQATNGSFHLGPSGYDSYAQLIAFKLDKDGNFLWSSAIECTSGSPRGIVFDKYTNYVYPIATYESVAKSGALSLTSPATSNADLASISFFWSIDANSGKIKDFKNLYVGESGTLIPLADHLAYFSSNMFTEDVPGNYLQLDRSGNIQKTKPISLSQLFQFQPADVSSGYYYDFGLTSSFGMLGFYDFRDRLRKFDLYGNGVKETDYSIFDSVRQQKLPVLSTGAIKAIDDHNLLIYASNLTANKTFYLGDSLATYDFRLTFMDDNFNINKNIKCSSTSYLVINSIEYDKADSSCYLLFSGNQQNTIKIGSAVINIPPHDINVNYTYLVKIKFDTVSLIDNTQPAIVSMVYDQQAQAAAISDTLATVISVAQPGTNLSLLSPVFTLTPGTYFKTQLPTTIDLSKPFTVSLLNTQGVQKDWTITVVKNSGRNNIDTLSLQQQLSYQRDTVNKTIDVLVDRSVDLHNTSFTSFVADQYTTVSPDPASVKDFSGTRTFSVTADNGNTAQWTVTVDRKLSSADDILALQLAGQIDTAHINDINKIVTIQSNNLQTSIESIKLSPGATLISPLNNITDFTAPVTFVVEAEDGSVANWQVNVSKLRFDGLNTIRLYPVPAVTTLNIAFKIPLQTESFVVLSSISGQQLFARTFSAGGSLPLDIDVSDYPEGVYILSITNSGHVYRQKVIIKR